MWQPAEKPHKYSRQAGRVLDLSGGVDNRIIIRRAVSSSLSASSAVGEVGDNGGDCPPLIGFGLLALHSTVVPPDHDDPSPLWRYYYSLPLCLYDTVG
jgi:hypothetical protein